MRKKTMKVIVILFSLLSLLMGCAGEMTVSSELSEHTDVSEDSLIQEEMPMEKDIVILGTETDRGFVLDNVLTTDELGEIHFNLSVPKSYDGTKEYALHIALPGWEGLYFQGIGEDLRWEYLPFTSTEYVEDMIVVSPQLNDWGITSAKQAICLTEYMMSAYRVDAERIYITGYSGGGETLSWVMELRPELYRAALFVSSRWDGNPQQLVSAKVPLYIFTSAHDSYYGADPARSAWQNVHDLYLGEGLTDDEIAKVLVLDVREDEWFDSMMEDDRGRTNEQYAMDYHGAGMLVAFDESVMEWVFKK